MDTDTPLASISSSTTINVKHKMVSIDELELIDFQTHKKTKIKFSPYFNVIVGPTRSGKSSVVRALDFLLYNTWYEDYQRIGSSKSILIAKLSNGKLLRREKGDKINRAFIFKNSADSSPDRFEAFGTDLPTEITSTLGVIPVDIGIKDPICANVANQDDPLFLLYTSGTDRTKVLSRLSGLHWLDYALKDLSIDRRTKTAEIQQLTDSNSQLTEKIKALPDLTKLRDCVEKEKERLAHLKKVVSLLRTCQLLLAKTFQWKKAYQEMQSLKSINFQREISKLERAIHLHSSIIIPLQDLDRRLLTTNQTTISTQKQLQVLHESRKTLERQIAEEEAKVPTCTECGRPLNINALT